MELEKYYNVADGEAKQNVSWRNLPLRFTIPGMDTYHPSDIQQKTISKKFILPISLFIVGLAVFATVAISKLGILKNASSGADEISPTPTSSLLNPGEVEGDAIEIITLPTKTYTPTPTKFIRRATATPTPYPTITDSPTPSSTPAPSITPKTFPAPTDEISSPELNITENEPEETEDQ